MKYILMLIYIILITGISCSTDCDNTDIKERSEAQELINVSYGSNAKQNFDLFLPEGRSETTKVIVLIHGGGWTSGDKNDLIGVYNYLKATGNTYAIANLNYTLADLSTKPIPLQINDIALFLAYIKDHAETYNIKPEFAFIGTSAGAHLSMLYAYKHNQNRDIKAVCNIVGPTDFLHTSYIDTSEPETAELIANVQTLFGSSIKDNAEYYKSISPYYWVNKTTPPTISFYGGNDFLVPEEQGLALKDVLDNYGIVNTYIFYEDEGHGWGYPNFLDTMQKLEAFFSSNF